MSIVIRMPEWYPSFYRQAYGITSIAKKTGALGPGFSGKYSELLAAAIRRCGRRDGDCGCGWSDNCRGCAQRTIQFEGQLRSGGKNS